MKQNCFRSTDVTGNDKVFKHKKAKAEAKSMLTVKEGIYLTLSSHCCQHNANILQTRLTPNY